MHENSRLFLLCALLVSCGAPPSASSPGGAASGTPSSSATSSTPDKGAKLSRRTGKAKATKLPDLSVTATRQLSFQGHFYVCANVPVSEDPGRILARISVESDRHNFAAKRATANGDELCVRFVGDAAPKDPIRALEMVEARRNRGSVEGGTLRNVHITGIARAAKDQGTRAAFFTAAAETLQNRASFERSEGFYAFASARLARIGDPKLARPGATPWAFAAPRPELDQLMDLYTGMTSVEEALQTDRGLFTAPTPQAATIDPKSISGVPMPAHPWPSMLAKLGKKPVVEPLAASVPADMLYAGFSDIRKLIVLLRELDAQVSPLAQTLEHGAGFRDFGRRSDEELALERTGLAEKLGNVAVDGVALAASDPFLREGTDVSMVFGIKNKLLLNGTLATFASRSKERHPTQTEKTYDLGGKKVTLISTPDGRVSRHQLELGNVLIVSNSKRALQRFVEVSEKKRKSLAESEDFRYFRAKTPFDPKAEDGFVFASDDFVRHAVSPRVKILAARRLERQADLSAINHAALLFGWLEGRTPKGTAELVQYGYLEKKELTHADGTRIDFDAERGAHSSWGRPARLTSLIDLDLGKVTAAERTAYDRFRESYQMYWRGYVDPIGARVSVSADGKKISADVRILPLIEHSDYRSMLTDVGEQHVKVPPLGSGLRWVLAIGKDAEVRRLGDQMANQFSRRKELAFSWIGDWVAAGAADRGGIWDFALQAGEIPELGTARKQDMAILQEVPIWAAVHVKSRLGLAAALTALRAMVQETAPGVTTWAGAGSYRGIEITQITAREDRRAKDEVRLSYAIVKDVLVVSFERGTLEQQIDVVLDGKMPDSSGGEVQSSIELRPANGGFLSRAVTGIIEAEAFHAHEQAMLGYEALARGIPKLPKERRAQALAFLGYDPVSPFAGEMSLEASGLVLHSTRGTPLEPVIPASDEGNGSVLQVVKNLARLSVGIGFEGKGNERGLHTTIEWERR
jgi:hypothetical protein